MIISKDYNNAKIKKLIIRGGVGVIPTDTLYGLVGSAFSEAAAERIYKLKKRDISKPLIVLISDFGDLKKFEIELSGELEKIVKKLWPARHASDKASRLRTPASVANGGQVAGGPGPASIILPAPLSKWKYLNGGGDTIAFRLPNNTELRKFIKEVGPIVAPSANPRGLKPAKNVEEIKNYFGDGIDFIIDGGIVRGEPSTLVAIQNGKIIPLRGKLSQKMV